MSTFTGLLGLVVLTEVPKRQTCDCHNEHTPQVIEVASGTRRYNCSSGKAWCSFLDFVLQVFDIFDIFIKGFSM